MEKRAKLSAMMSDDGLQSNSQLLQWACLPVVEWHRCYRQYAVSASKRRYGLILWDHSIPVVFEQ